MPPTLPTVEPMELVQQTTPFNHDEWLFEIKHDGFRAMAYIEFGICKLVSRNDFAYKRFADLMLVMPSDIKATNAIIDGELVVLDDDGRAQFNDLMHGRMPALFAAFDLLWLNDVDLRELPLLKRKQMLRQQIRRAAKRTFFVDHIVGEGVPLYEQMCARDMEGIVCKPLVSPYRKVGRRTTWIKVKNPNYSQAVGRTELFNGRRRRAE